MAWVIQWWTFLVAAAILFVPGMIAARAIGLRRLGQWAFAPVASTAMVVLLAIVYPLIGLTWNGLTAAIGVALLTAVCVFAARALRVPASTPQLHGRRGPLLLGLAGGVILGAVRVIAYIGAPENVSQSNDAPFHLGAVRAILEHGAATPFGLGGLVDPEAPGAFYPGAWHAMASLIATFSGAGIPQTTNVLTVMVAAVVWPLGVAWMTQAATGRRLAAAAAAALSPALIAFPLLLIQYGILYSYLLAVALLPAAVAVVVELLPRPDERLSLLGRGAGLIVGIGMVLLALAMAQTSVILAWGLLVGLYAAGRLWVGWGALPSRGRWAGLAALVSGFALLTLLWVQMSRMVTADYWGSVRTPAGAALDLVSSGYAGTPAMWVVSVLAVVGGVAALLRRRTSWLSVAWLAFALLYGVAAAVDTAAIRLPLVGPWYGDTYRLAALLPALTVPLAAIGVVALVDAAVRIFRAAAVVRRAAGWVSIGLILVVLAGGVAAEPVTQRYHVANGVTETQSRFTIDDETWLTRDERALIERLPDSVESGARVIGNPGTGAAFGFALSGVDVFPAKWQVPRSATYAVLAEGLRDAASDPEVCAAVEELGVAYVVDFGPGDAGTGRVEMPGFTAFDGQPGFERVDSEGAASLWRVSACSR
ncbi:DUF6541 family protein [Microbacterium invictum]|uniref:Uncharacterized protein n=1 Tax=Microbacterium invictum TaxID=515415 RepID=A0AA40SP80_9MICO|nr:DUF6541 family protein [Microbacterium invictum]MBB4139779.1 hypothetical protein [Microbacterium invictum]